MAFNPNDSSSLNSYSSSNSDSDSDSPAPAAAAPAPAPAAAPAAERRARSAAPFLFQSGRRSDSPSGLRDMARRRRRGWCERSQQTWARKRAPVT